MCSVGKYICFQELHCGLLFSNCEWYSYEYKKQNKQTLNT